MLLRPEKQRYSCLSGGCAIVITTGKKKIQSSVWQVRDRYYNRRIKKFQSSVWRVLDRYYDRKIKKFQLSVWRVRDRYYNRKNKKYSRLSGGCAIVITTGKKKFQSSGCEIIVVCLAGARWLLRPENKKSSSRLSGWCAIVITTGK